MPRMMGFIGGSDVHRSPNLSDDKLINLYPVVNDKGDRAALIATPGLSIYAAIPNGAIATGIHKASNGRCFVTASGGYLYELTAGGVMTLRGMITHGVVVRMEDNGIDLIIVNGVDGWLFKFATNTLSKISVIQATFTVTIAAPAVLSTIIPHGLIAGDVIRLGTTGVLPTGLDILIDYYVLAAGLTPTSFSVSLLPAGVAVTTTGIQSGAHHLNTIGYGFPNGCQTISYMHGRFIACQPNTQNFFVSEVLDAPRWDVLNVQTVDSNPDDLVVGIASHNEIVMFCKQSAEVFYDSGAVPSPFVRNVSGVFEVGCTAPFSVTKVDNTIIFLGNSSYGHGMVYRLQGFTPMRISTYSIEYAIQSMANTDDAIAFSYQQEGHTFYVLTFPGGGRTFVYDIGVGIWHERAGFQLDTLTRWEVQEYAYFDNKHLVCDYQEGVIYSLDMNVQSNGTLPRKWVRSWRSPDTDMQRVIHSKLTIEAEVGVGLNATNAPKVMLRYSNDGGHTWSNELWRDLGAIGEYKRRIVWHRLGMTTGQARIYELSGTEPVKTVLLGAILE